MVVKIQVAVITVAFVGSVTAVGVLALFLVDNWTEDSLEEKDVQLVAELLCPSAPEDVRDNLFYFQDEGVPFVGVKDADDAVSFYITEDEDSDEPVLEPAGEAALAYMQSMPLSCFAVEAAPPPPTDTP